MAYRYQVRVFHKGLGKERILTASDQYVLNSRAQELMARWDSQYEKELERERRIDERNQKKQDLEDNFDEARTRTEDAMADIESLETLLVFAIKARKPFDWDSLKNQTAYSSPYPAPPIYKQYPSQPVSAPAKIGFLGAIIPAVRRARVSSANVEADMRMSRWTNEVNNIESHNKAVESAFADDVAHWESDWLNNHPDAAQQWPGKELIKPLQEIWADGVVDQRELHRLARILISIQREWARRPKTKVSHLSSGTLPDLISANIHEVRLPSFSIKFRIPSRSEAGLSYDVDLDGPSCSCPDWRGKRSRLPIGHFSRCCKHIFDAYAQLPRKGPSDLWLLAFLDNGWPSHPRAEWDLLTVGDDAVLFCTAVDNGWANVFAKEDALYERYGYNVDEDRWAYGSQPHGASTIARAISSIANPMRDQ